MAPNTAKLSNSLRGLNFDVLSLEGCGGPIRKPRGGVMKHADGVHNGELDALGSEPGFRIALVGAWPQPGFCFHSDADLGGRLTWPWAPPMGW